jgi:hypothetical protein
MGFMYRKLGKMSNPGVGAVVRDGFKRKPKRNGNFQKPSRVAEIKVIA